MKADGGGGATDRPSGGELRDGARRPGTSAAIDVLSTENQILELVATGRPLREVLDALVGAIEARCDGATASVLLMSDDGRRLWHGSAPGLPEEYNKAVDGIRIGPCVGSCGTAAHRGERVIVADTANDPLWAGFVGLVEQYGLRACWSQPIFSADRKVLGTFAMYYNRPQEPGPFELDYIEVAAHLAGIAIGRDRAERARLAEGRRRFEQSATLVELTKSESLAASDLQAFVRLATESAARTLGVERVGVWLFNGDRSTLRCQDLFESSADRHTDGTELKSDDFPRYFAALERGRAVVAHDACEDPDTSEFAESYLVPKGISSMLDAPIRRSGRLAGVVCHEHVGPARVWTADEQDFSASVADMISLAIEASERRLAERAYRSAEQTLLRGRDGEPAEVRGDLNRIFELSSDLLCVAGTDGYFRRINPAFEKVLGYTHHELMAEPLLRFVHPDDRQRTLEEIDNLSRGRPMVGFVTRYRCKDGSYRWLEWSAMSVPEEGALYAVARDITRQRAVERRQRDLLSGLKDMTSALDRVAIVSRTDARGTFRYVNDQLCQISGYSRQELLGQSNSILDSGHHTDDFFGEMSDTIARGEAWKGEVCCRSKDGNRYWLDTTIAPLLDGSGVPREYLSIQFDITDRKKSEARLLQLSNAVEQTGDAVFITDREGKIEYVNRAFEETTGYSRQDALGKSPRILKSGKQDGKHYRRLWETILKGEVYRSEIINRRKNGELYYAEQTITPIKGPDGQVARFVSVVKDMTERRESQRRELEIELASRVQRKLYPECPPRLDGFDLAGAVFFAKATCGDCFDFIDMKDRSLGIAVGDVCGHGFGPALLMSETRAYLRSLVRVQSDLGEILNSINDSLAADLEDHYYVTLILTRLDPSTGSLTWVNAGHIPGYVLDRSGTVKAELNPSGLPLGMFSGSEYLDRENVAIEPGEILVLLTDGVTELQDRSGRFFGAPAVLEVIRAHRHEPAERLVARVREAAEQFGQGRAQADDITIVICKRLPEE